MVRTMGSGARGGVEVVSHSLRSALLSHRGSGLALLKIDFKNAFNAVSRDAFMRGSCERFPGLAHWTSWCYGEGSVLLYDHQHTIESVSGVQQGDPLGPLYFCCALAPLIEEIQGLNPEYNKWYMIAASSEVLQQVWDTPR